MEIFFDELIGVLELMTNIDCTEWIELLDKSGDRSLYLYFIGNLQVICFYV